jgi:prefoldin subunit 5
VAELERLMEPEDQGLNIEEASAGIAADLFGAEPPPEDAPIEDAPETPVSAVAETAPVTETVQTPAPKSWAKETHELWTKLPPEAQNQVLKREQEMLSGLEQYKEHFSLGKTLNEVIAPYKPTLEAQGIDTPKAVGTLLAAHARLTQGSPEQRLHAYQELGRNLGLVQGQTDPALKAYEQRIERLESTLTQSQRAQFQAAQTKVSNEVAAFAKDKPYFDEVADDIIVYLGAGHPLEDAYDKAVYANPVTRQKELARLKTEAEAELRKKSKDEADAARKAKSSNVRSRDTGRSPTEPLGTMEDTMRETLAIVKARPH